MWSNRGASSSRTTRSTWRISMSDRGRAEADGRGGRMTDQSIVINQGGFLLFLGAITLAMVYVVWPFAAPVLWATLAAIMFQPLYRWFLVRLRNGPNRAAIASLLGSEEHTSELPSLM